MSVRRVAGRLLDANRRASRDVESRLPQARTNIRSLYRLAVAQRLNGRPGQLAVDVGGGRHCEFAAVLKPESRTRVVAVDISEDALAANTDVDEKRVADVTTGLPFADAEVDLVASHSVLEHLVDVRPFAAEAYRVLKPGGYTIHAFPSKRAPFALANRALPATVSHRLVHALLPDSEGRLGFPAYYDHCSEGAMQRLLEREGFEIVDSRVGYYQSDYFESAFPLYLASALYELAVSALRLRGLAAHVLIVAQKPRAGATRRT